MSLVADYSDSDENAASDAEGEAGGQVHKEKGSLNDKTDSTPSNNNSIEGNDDDISGGSKGANFLLPESESSDSEDDDERKPKTRITLDNPFRSVGDVNVAKEDSVFRNPFRDKEEERIAVLERHVKMTDNPETALTINGKKICWNYRKRKCYLGTQCPYAHDSDVPLTEEQLKEQKIENDLHRAAGGNFGGGGGTGTSSQNNSFNNPPHKTHLPGSASVVAGGYDSSAFFSSPHLGGGGVGGLIKLRKEEEEEEEEKNPKKKRARLTNGLIPTKRALNLYYRTKDQK